jgi:methionine biosynthesis protein MetW
VDGRGIEIDGPKVQRAIARGVSVYQSDIDEGLAGYPDDSFDYVILSQTLQETRRPLDVLRDMLRIARHAIVAFPNYGHWAVRLSLLTTGRAPRSRCFPFEWYNSPNIHFLTIRDFEALARERSWTVERKMFLAGHRTGVVLPNLMAEVAVYQVRK